MLLLLLFTTSFRAILLTQASIPTERSKVVSTPTVEPEGQIPVPCGSKSIIRSKVFLLYIELSTTFIYFYIEVDI